MKCEGKINRKGKKGKEGVRCRTRCKASSRQGASARQEGVNARNGPPSPRFLFCCHYLSCCANVLMTLSKTTTLIQKSKIKIVVVV